MMANPLRCLNISNLYVRLPNLYTCVLLIKQGVHTSSYTSYDVEAPPYTCKEREQLPTVAQVITGSRV